MKPMRVRADSTPSIVTILRCCPGGTRSSSKSRAVLVRHAGRREGVEKTRPASEPERAGSIGVGEDLADRDREAFRVPRLDEPARDPVDQDFVGAADSGRHDRQPLRHSFQHRQRQALEARWQDEEIRGGQEIRHVGAMAHEADRMGDTERRRLVP